MEKKILVITGANTAKEINPEGQDPSTWYKNDQFEGKFYELYDKWQQAEQSLKEYRIANDKVYKITKDWNTEESDLNKMYPVGSKVECEVNEETLEAIIL